MNVRIVDKAHPRKTILYSGIVRVETSESGTWIFLWSRDDTYEFLPRVDCGRIDIDNDHGGD